MKKSVVGQFTIQILLNAEILHKINNNKKNNYKNNNYNNNTYCDK